MFVHMYVCTHVCSHVLVFNYVLCTYFFAPPAGGGMKPVLHQLSVKTIGHLVEKGMYKCLNVRTYVCTCVGIPEFY